MGVDFENFGLGLAVGWASAYGIYRVRHQISQALQATQNQAQSAQNYATRSADGRYINDLIGIFETTHLAGQFVKLSDILVEPQFLSAPPAAAPQDEDDVVHSVFHIVPKVPDHPYLHAVYNLETLSIGDLATGDHALALLGLPGSGRTTALLSIAMYSLGQLRFLEAEDKIQRNLDEEEAALSDKERADRVKERALIEERARERLKDEHGISFDHVGQEQTKGAGGNLFNRLMPVYVHLANVNIDPAEFGSEIDPAEPLIRAMQSQVGRVTASTLPRNLYNRLNDGEALLLIDGLDELSQSEQNEKIIWLRQFMSQYASNFFIIAGSAQGYGALLELGFAPVFLRPWDDLMTETAITRWAEAWPHIAGKGRRSAAPPAPELIDRIRSNNRALSPTDLSLKIWSSLGDDAQVPGYEGWLRACIARHLPKDQPIDSILPRLAQAAALQLEEGFITADRLEALAAGSGDTADIAAMLNSMESDDTETEEDPQKAAKGKEDTASVYAKLLTMLRRTGLIVEYRNGRYQFRHSFIAAYLASLLLKDQAYVVEKALDSNWNQAFAYATLHTSVDEAVKARLSAPKDILHNNMLELARWLSYAGTKATWNGGLLKQLGAMLIAPNQYPLTRERVAAALIGTRDKKTLFVFRQAARNANPQVRILACLGMGAIGENEATKDLSALLNDQVIDVQLAAGMGLGAIGTDEALEDMVIALTEGSEQLRQAIAEALAANPVEGHPILFDAITHEDMMLRRAAAFGLRRLKSIWSVTALYRAFLEDEQWYVRSAAQQAFQDIQGYEQRGPRNYPTPQELDWLSAWAAKRGEGIPSGEGGVQLLINALQEAEPDVRALSAQILGQTGQLGAAKALYNALRDRQEEVRSSAHRALSDLELQSGKPLPALN